MNYSSNMYNWENKRIVILENDEVTIILLQEILKDNDAQIIIVNDINSVIDLCKTDLLIDCIIMDIQTQDLNAIDVITEIRQTRKNLPVLAVMSGLASDEKENYIESGYNNIIAKPVDIDKFLGLVNKYLTN